MASRKADPRMKVAVRFDEAVFEAADRVIESVGIGDRPDVIRTAAMFGLKAFLTDSSLIAQARQINFADLLKKKD